MGLREGSRLCLLAASSRGFNSCRHSPKNVEI
jgi:hypothetical protein